MRVYAIDKENKREEFEKRLDYKYRLIYRVGVATGLRVSDIITLEKKALEIREPTIREQKTGKSKRIYIPKKLRAELKSYSQGNEKYIFQSDISETGHITRQAVWKHFKKVAKEVGIKINVGTHTMRKAKVYNLMKKGKDYTYIKNKLNHSNLADTLLYMLKP